MKNILLLVLLIPLMAITQNQTKIDSLNHLLLSSKNEEKAIIFSDLSEIYAQSGEADKALTLAEEALELAKRNRSRSSFKHCAVILPPLKYRKGKRIFFEKHRII